MNKQRRNELTAIADKLRELMSELEELSAQEEEAHDAMPESFQEGERGDAMRENISEINDAANELDNQATNIDAVVER